MLVDSTGSRRIRAKYRDYDIIHNLELLKLLPHERDGRALYPVLVPGSWGRVKRWSHIQTYICSRLLTPAEHLCEQISCSHRYGRTWLAWTPSTRNSWILTIILLTTVLLSQAHHNFRDDHCGRIIPWSEAIIVLLRCGCVTRNQDI